MTTRTAIVTGSTSGIGLGVATELARGGANIVLNGFGDADAIEKVRTELAAAHGVEALYHGADMSKPDEIVELIGFASDRLGSVDILVNNAGIQHSALVEDFPLARWDQIIAINLSSNFHSIRAALPLMRANGWGRIVNIASVHGLVASAQKSAYVAAKHGVIGLTKTVALETASSAVTCNAICPGWVLTPLVERQIDDVAARESLSVDEAKARLLFEKQPSGEFATPAQIGAIASFLCSEAAAEIRGAAITVDGGWTAR